MPCSWEGLEEGDEHPPTLSCGAWLTLILHLMYKITENKLYVSGDGLIHVYLDLMAVKTSLFLFCFK